MMQADERRSDGRRQERGGSEIPMLIAVTQLTSTDEEMMHQELLVNGEMEEWWFTMQKMLGKPVWTE